MARNAEVLHVTVKEMVAGRLPNHAEAPILFSHSSQITASQSLWECNRSEYCIDFGIILAFDFAISSPLSNQVAFRSREISNPIVLGVLRQS
jgi:hypothetical protein